jgi:hypothetical protein
VSADLMTQEAPYPTALEEVVRGLTYRPGWTFTLEYLDRGQGSLGLTFVVTSRGYDTYNPDRGETYRVHHYMVVPAASYDRGSWERWVLDQLLLIEQHETCEFMVVDGRRPFAPNHGPGRDPYVVRELGTVADAETTFRGERREGSQGD